jgi:hypothetical protein
MCLKERDAKRFEAIKSEEGKKSFRYPSAIEFGELDKCSEPPILKELETEKSELKNYLTKMVRMPCVY